MQEDQSQPQNMTQDENPDQAAGQGEVAHENQEKQPEDIPSQPQPEEQHTEAPVSEPEHHEAEAAPPAEPTSAPAEPVVSAPEPPKTEESAPPTPEPPKVEEPAPIPPPSTGQSDVLEGAGAAKKKILLVEDDVALAAVYRSRFELEDFDLFEVNDGEHALTAAKEFKPDLILLDAMMPKISGFDVLDILRHTPETANIRVIMLTALSQPKDKERAENLGVDDYLVKSQVVIGDVVERVKHHLGMK